MCTKLNKKLNLNSMLSCYFSFFFNFSDKYYVYVLLASKILLFKEKVRVTKKQNMMSHFLYNCRPIYGTDEVEIIIGFSQISTTIWLKPCSSI